MRSKRRCLHWAPDLIEPFGLIDSKWHWWWVALDTELSLITDGLFGVTTIWCGCFALSYNLSYATYGRVGSFASLMGTWADKRVKERHRKRKSLDYCVMLNVSLVFVLSCQEMAGSATCVWNMDLQARTLGWLSTARMLLCWIVLKRLLWVLGICLVCRTYRIVKSGHLWVGISAKRDWITCAIGQSLCLAGRKDIVSLLEADFERSDPVVTESICYVIGSTLLLWLELSQTLRYENRS